MIDMGFAFEPRAIDVSMSSYQLGAQLKDAGANLNALLLPSFAQKGDTTGSYAAAYAHMVC